MRRITQLFVLLLCLISIDGWKLKETQENKPTENDEGLYNGEPLSTSHWIDPDNMVDVDNLLPKPTSSIPVGEQNLAKAFKNIQEQLHNCETQLRALAEKTSLLKEKTDCGSPHLKQIIQALLMSTSDDNPFTHMTLTPEVRNMLKKFIDDKANIHDVTETLKSSVSEKSFSESINDSYWARINEKIDVLNVLVILLAFLTISGVIVFQMRTQLTIRKQFIYLLIVAFIISVPWEWFRLYKKEFAQKQSMMIKNIEKHCHTDHQLSIAQSIRIWGKSLFSVEENSCSKYQEALLIDPIWEVPPFMAVSVTVTRFIVQPFELFADATGKSFRALFQHLPIQWQPVMFLACVIIIILCLILFSGIRISTPFLQIGLGVDPAITNASLQRLEQQIQHLNAAAIEANRNAPAIQNIQEVDNGNQLVGIFNQLNAMNERSQGHENSLREIKDFLLLLRPVAEQARQAEAVENHERWEMVGNGPHEESPSELRRPVQSSEQHPMTE